MDEFREQLRESAAAKSSKTNQPTKHMQTDQQTIPANPDITLTIKAKGELVSSNFDAFAIHARRWLADINRNLRTDDDFDQAAADVKKAKETEELLEVTREAVLAEATTINAELAKLGNLSEEMRAARLELSRQIEKAKADQRQRLIDGALTQLGCDPSMRLGFRAEIETAIKGKKSMDSMREAVRVAVAIANDRITRAKIALDDHEKEHGTIHDRRNLECTEPVALAAELRRRVDVAKANAEAARQREIADKARQEAATARASADAEKAKAEVAMLAATTPEAKDDAQAAADQYSLNTVPVGTWVTSPIVKEPLLDQRDQPISSAATEWQIFRGIAIESLNEVNAARKALAHPENSKRAGSFWATVTAAWKEANQ